MRVSLTVAGRGTLLADEVTVARTARQRARGLLKSPPLRHGQALILPRAHQVHTIGMSYPIDVLFCDGEWNVLRVIRPLRPNRISAWVGRARCIVELPAGSAEVRVGERLIFDEGL